MIEPRLVPFVKRQLEATYQLMHQNDLVREKPMKDELSRLKNELETMELNLATSRLPLDLFQKHSTGHKTKIASIENELKILLQDTSNLASYLEKTLDFVQNLMNLWQNLDWDDKVRLQKLVYPNGLIYKSEKHELRTNQSNPILTAISSISRVFRYEQFLESGEKNEKLRQVYLMFGSSNFFWEKLEETAIILTDLTTDKYRRERQGVVSATGETSTVYTISTTGLLLSNSRNSAFNPVTTRSLNGLSDSIRIV